MSAAPQFPPGYGPEELPQQPPAPPRRPLWQRILLWAGIGILILIVVAVVAVYALLHSRSAHAYILRTAQQKASAALNTNVRVQEFSLNFSGISPTLDLYGVVVDGAQPHPTPPLLQVSHVRVAVRITSIFNRQWYLNEITINEPVVQVLVDQNGHSNVPQMQSSGSSSNTNIFDLGIRHALLDRGVVLYNNYKSVMEADLHDLDLRAHFNTGDRSYAGTLAYNDGHLRMADYNTIAHSFHADFVATPTQFVLRNATLQSGPSQVVLNATVTNYSNPNIAATYTANLNGGEFRQILKNPTVPTGIINLSGKLDYIAKPGVPALQGVNLQGTLHSNELTVRTPQFSGPIRDLNANYSVQNGNLKVPNLSAQLLGGQLKGALTVNDIAGAQQAHLNAALNNVSVGSLKSLVKSPALNNVSVAGKADANLQATWGKSFSNLDANVIANLNSTVTPNRPSPQAVPGTIQTSADYQPIPVTGHIQLHYSGKSKQLSVTNSYIRTPQTTLSLNGALNGPTGLAINLDRVDLHQVASLATVFSTNAKTAVPPGLAGIASFHGQVKGALTAPRLTGLLQINSLVVNGSQWRLLRTNVDISPARAALSNGLLLSYGPGQATFGASVGLHQWSFTNTSPITAALDARQLNLANLSKAAKLQTPITGSLSLNLNLRGTESTPMGDAHLQVANAQVSGQPIRAANVKATSNGNLVQANLSVNLPAGTATANGTYDLRQQNYNVLLRAVGIQLGQLAAVKSKDLGVVGTLNLTAEGAGNIHNPQLAANLSIPKLQVKDQTINNLDVKADVANHVARVALGSQVVNTSIAGNATINLTGNYETIASLDTQTIPLAPLVAAYAPTQAGNITGQTELHGNLRGPLKQPKNVEAHITIPTLAVNYQNKIHIGAPQPIHIDYVSGVLNVQRSALKGTDTDLQFQGRVPIVDKNAPASVLLLGTVDLQLLQVFNPDYVTSGQVRFDINSFGQLTNPNVQGQVRIINATLATGEVPLGLSNGNGVLTLTRDRLEITQFNGIVGGGDVTAHGAVLYRPSLSFDMALQGKGIRLLYPDGVRSGFGMNLFLTGTTDAATLRGQVNLYQVSFTPDFDLTSLMGQFGGDTTPPPSQGFSNNLQLDLQVRTLQGLNLVSRQLSLDGGMNLNVRGSAAQPVVLGRINLTGGDFLFNNERFVLQGGTIDFVNPTMTQPVLNVSVNTTVQQYKVAMRFEGPVDHMRTSYSSDPALPPADIIHLIAFGSTTESSAANPSPPGNLAAEQKIASAVSGQVTSRVAKIAGLSQLSIDPTLGGSGTQSSPGAHITIQQRVTSKIFVTFSTDVTATQNQVIQLEYKASPRFSFSGTRDQNGGVAFDTRIHKAW
ncbi:MAG: translocation/assembly module TamB domain-containing protein [Terriglobales bacterium]